MDELLTVHDCAILLSVAPSQVRDYINDGLIKAHKLGAVDKGKSARQWRVWQKDLEEFINRQ